MPFDGVFTNSIVRELSEYTGTRIEKIHQPSREEILFQIKKERGMSKLLLSVNPAYPRLQFTNTSFENPQTPPTFCMILRKHLTGGRIIAVNQINFDRIVEITIEGRDELGYSLTYHLIIEIMGKHSNLILLNDKRIIIDSIKHVGSDMSRYREVLPGLMYISPPAQDKLNPLEISKHGFEELLNANSSKTAVKLLTSSFFGIGRNFADEVCRDISEIAIDQLDVQLREIFISNFFFLMSRIKSGEFKSIMFCRGGDMVDYYCMNLQQYDNLEKLVFESSSELLDTFYGARNIKDKLKQKYNDIFKLITNLLERNFKKTHIYMEKMDECRDYEKWKIYGDLIMANQYTITSGSREVELEDFYQETLPLVTVPLDEDLSPVDNAKKYYKKYSKDKSTLEIVSKQLDDSRVEHDYLESILYTLENATDMDTIEEIKGELAESGYVKRKKRLNSKQGKSSPHHYVSSDGYDIYVGKNNHQNDYLTTKFAINSDFWMHTKNIPGSHVIIKSRGGEVSDTALLEGALLAAYFSKAKGSAKVPVDYTERKNVKKPSGSKPGMVIYFTNKTIYVTPEEDKINRIKKI